MRSNRKVDSIESRVDSTFTVLLLCLTCWWVGCAAEPQESPVTLQDKLKTLAYVRSAPTDSVGGVVKNDRSRAYPGIHIYTSGEDRKAMLLDMDGQALHTLIDRRRQPSGEWDMVEPYGDGEFLVLVLWQSILRIDWDSRILWELKRPFHHDISVAENGDIYALSIEELPSSSSMLQVPAVFDVLLVISPDGRVKKELRLASVLAKHAELVHVIQSEQGEMMSTKDPFTGVYDPTHTNTVEVIPRDVVIEDQTVFRKGQVLLCVKNMNLVAVLDVEAEEFVWFWGIDHLDRPHCPTLLDNNHLLIFDNGDVRGFSRIVELDPQTKKITHIISGRSSEAPFSSYVMGQAQRLPNGNTLITSSTESRAFELTVDGEIVWEFHAFQLATNPTSTNRPYRLPRIVEFEQIEQWSRRLPEKMPTPTSKSKVGSGGMGS